MVTALIAMALTPIGSTSPHFDFLGGKVSEKVLRVARVSQNGQVVLGAAGPARMSTFWLLDKDSERQVKDVVGDPIVFVAVGNDGTLIGNSRDRVDPSINESGQWSRGFTLLGDDMKFVDSAPNSDGRTAVALSGFSRSQLLLGMRQEFGARMKTGTFVVGLPGTWSSLFSFSKVMLDPYRLYTDTNLGFLAEVDITPSEHRGTYAPAYIRDGVPYPFELLAQNKAGLATAWSPDGTIVAGKAGGAAMPAIIWREGRVWAVVKDDDNRCSFWPKGVAKGGRLVVGSDGLTERTTAVAWSEKTGVQPLGQYLKSRKVRVPRGWTLIDANYVSPDATQIVGTAEDKSGRQRPFRATMPNLEADTD